ncbi:SPASM domain-containing protein [Herbaspirillum frisingense]|uniref:SPASM domain-containing protein n=1 Tax=Herbaspirillum frisingense TaxID=92645 RepID=UPI0015FF6318|nr:SPASM domain-containing protein [Herbaspirillum frisingense]QNB08824.1 SPASM domain-containing protein [Herbaspirillum frisingense]
MLDQEKIDFITEYDITVRISHDAMAQALRGPDPFDEPGRLEIFRQLWKVRGDKFGFNSVITSGNSDVLAIADWFREKIGGPVSVSFEGVVHSYDIDNRDNHADWTAEQYRQMQYNVMKALISDSDLARNSVLGAKAENFIASLREKRPSSSLGQKCGMDRPDYLAVDLKGNVTTCQNVGSAGKHGIGHVSDIDAIALDTSWHWSKRENCSHCPMLQLCKGACMYNEGEDFVLSCENEFHFNWAIMTGALYWLTGKLMVGIEGDIRRPARRRVIPLTAIAA